MKRWAVEVDLDQGETIGRMTLDDLGCSGDLRLTATSDTVLQFVAVMDDNPNGVCASGGLVRLDRFGDEQLSFSWRDAQNPKNRATGLLRLN